MVPSSARERSNLNRVSLLGNDWIQGTGDNNGKGCTIFIVTDAAFVTGVPTLYLSGVTIKNIKFVNGTSPIDFGTGNDLHVDNVQLFNNTNCGVVAVDGERMSFTRLVGTHTGANGFATLCTGDKTKSLFSASISGGNKGLARTYINGIQELGSIGGLGYSTQYLWWGGEAVGGNISSTDASNFVCFFSCTSGYIWMDSMFNGSRLATLDMDHVGQSGTPETVGLYINTSMVDSRIDGYTPAYNTNYITSQATIGQFEQSVIQNSAFCTGCNNSTTFGLKLTYSGTNNGVLTGVDGAVYYQNPQNTSALGGSALPTNAPAATKLFDPKNTGEWFGIGNGGSAATGVFQFCRYNGSGSWPCDFTSDGVGINLNFPIKNKEVTAPSGASGYDWLWGDSTAHRLEMNNNNGGAVQVVGSGADINTSDQVTALHLSGTGIARNDGSVAELSGDCTTSGSNAVNCTKTGVYLQLAPYYMSCSSTYAPNVTITGVTGTSGTLTFATSPANSLATGNTVTLYGFTGSAVNLNGQVVTVISSGLSTSQFEAAITGSISGSSSGAGNGNWAPVTTTVSGTLSSGSTSVTVAANGSTWTGNGTNGNGIYIAGAGTSGANVHRHGDRRRRQCPDDHSRHRHDRDQWNRSSARRNYSPEQCDHELIERSYQHLPASACGRLPVQWAAAPHRGRQRHHPATERAL